MKENTKTIKKCRISGSEKLVSILNLGNQALTGVFPKDIDAKVKTAPLDLTWCPDSGLVQLRNSCDLEEMYGMNYGYRSGLNLSMVQHLQQKVKILKKMCPIISGDIILDIGSNDATLLSAYEVQGVKRIGIDPTGKKFQNFYKDGIELIPEFFSLKAFRTKYKTSKAKIITSIAMFYDLESPLDFVSDIYEILDDDGIWHFEQSYMPTMLRMNSYDTVCHEHLEYYSLGVVKAILELRGLKIIDVQMNSINGGSFAVTAAKKSSKLKSNETIINWILGQEDRMNLDTLKPYKEFEERVIKHRDDLSRLIRSINGDKKKIVGYGASTKGNVLLQYCGFNSNNINCIAEVNPDKFGSITPGSNIPILSEKEVRTMKPDYMLVLPWHFRDSIIKRESEFLCSGGKLIFPFPEIEIV
jgi:hypothetical protein